jgi:hypothetical protein
VDDEFVIWCNIVKYIIGGRGRDEIRMGNENAKPQSFVEKLAVVRLGNFESFMEPEDSLPWFMGMKKKKS